MTSKKITIIASARSGSNWLCSAFNPQKSFIAWELFNWGYPSMGMDLLNMLQGGYNVNEQELLSILPCHPNQMTAEQRKSHIASFKFWNRIYEVSCCLNLNLVTKLFLQHTQNNLDAQLCIEKSDFIIRLYRKNILHKFISHKVAETSNCWTNSDYQKKGNSKQTIKLCWKESEYIQYYNTYFAKEHSFILQFAKDISSITLSYEQLHEAGLTLEQKSLLLSNFLVPYGLNALIKLEQPQTTFREPHHENLESYFMNPKDFLKSLSYPDFPILVPPN